MIIVVLSITTFIFLLSTAFLYHKNSIQEIKHKSDLEDVKYKHQSDVDLLKHQTDVEDVKHESELKELEELFTNKVKEFTDVIEEYEMYLLAFQKYYDQLNQIIKLSDAKINKVDVRGAFKADDEIGFFFETLKEIQSTLNEFDFNKQIVHHQVVKEDKPSPIDTDGKGIIYIQEEKFKEVLNQK